LATALARQTTSGTNPARSNAHIRPVRAKPVWTSSAMRSTPFVSQKAPESLEERVRRRVVAVPSPRTGSIRTAAIESAGTVVRVKSSRAWRQVSVARASSPPKSR
jgi:hypothetical protein